MLCFVGSVQQGLQRVTEDEVAQRTLIVFQEPAYVHILGAKFAGTMANNGKY
jgi:hypothetical protein